MPKVLFVVPHLSNSMRLLADYLRYLDKSFKVTLFVMEPDLRFDREFPSDARRVILPNNGTRYLEAPAMLWKLYREVRNHDIVIAWAELRETYVTAVAGFFGAKPVIGWVHSALSRVFALKQRPGRLHSPVMKLIYPRLSAVVGVSDGVRDDLRNNLKIANAISIVNGIDIDRVKELGEAPIAEEHRAIFDEPVLINVAAFTFQKNQEVLLEAHSRLIKEGIRHRLLFVGDGPLREKIGALAKELGVESSVFYTGYVDNPYAYMRRSTAFVLSSRWEGHPLCLAEALALGLPVVSTDCDSGPGEILDRGNYGMLVPVGDVEAFTGAVRRVLTDTAGRDEIKRKTSEGAERNSIRPRVKEMEQLLWSTFRGDMN